MKITPQPSGDLTIVISSCDPFFDAWAPFLCLFFRYWPDCPHRVVLLTNHLKLDAGPVQALRLGDDQGWSNNLITALNSIESDHVVYIQEDHFLLGNVLNDQFQRAFVLVRDQEMDGLTFRARKPQAGARMDDSLPVFFPAPESREAVFCDPTIWNRRSLLGLLEPGESAWDFLKTGRERASQKHYRRAQWHLSHLKECPIRYMKRSGIRESLWHFTALQLLRREKVPVGRWHRGIHLQSFHLKRALKKTPDDKWLRLKHTGFGVGAWLTLRQKALSVGHLRRVLADDPERVIPVHAVVDRYLRSRNLRPLRENV